MKCISFNERQSATAAKPQILVIRNGRREEKKYSQLAGRLTSHGTKLPACWHFKLCGADSNKIISTSRIEWIKSMQICLFSPWGFPPTWMMMMIVWRLLLLPKKRISSGSRPAAKVAAAPAKNKKQDAASKTKSKTKATSVVRPLPAGAAPVTKNDVLRLLQKWMAKGSVPACPQSHNHCGLTVGSACSGWCSDLLALQRLGRRHTCCFASDIDPHGKTLCSRTYQHCRWIDDVTSDEFLHLPAVDLFTAGFPCQPFSLAGMALGMDEERGILVLFLIRYIGQARPRCFILENVEGLVKMHKHTLALLLEVLTSLLDETGAQLHLS